MPYNPCPINDYDNCPLSLGERCDCWHEAGCPSRQQVYEEVVRSILPDSYTVATSKEPHGIRCISPVGIREGIDDEDEEQWGYIMAALRQRFGPRLSEVSHNVNFCHTDFTIFWRPSI